MTVADWWSLGMLVTAILLSVTIVAVDVIRKARRGRTADNPISNDTPNDPPIKP